MAKLQKIVAVVTAVDIGTPIALDSTPLLGGRRHEAILRIGNLPLTSTVKLQGADALPDGTAPAEGDAAWTDIVTLTSASDVESRIVLPDWIRWNTTVLDADGPNVVAYLEGEQ